MTIEEILSKLSLPFPAYFDLAKLFYKVVFNYKTYAAVDLHGTATAFKYDLNHALPISEKYDIVTNFGTAEHVFNQYMLFKNIHDLTKENGFMMHFLPNQRYYDHGFFNYHPTFIFDLGQANGYTIFPFIFLNLAKKPPEFIPLPNREAYVRMAVENRLSSYSALFAVCKKTGASSEFQMPMQGYYDNQLPEELRAAWSKLDK